MIETSAEINEIATACAKVPEFFEDGYWGSLLGYSKYLISAEGRIISFYRNRKPRLLKGGMRGKYLGITIFDDNGSPRSEYIHRLVLEISEGPCPPGQEARHLNGNPLDNRIANLTWGTRTENHADKRRHGTSAKGERNPQAKLTISAVREMRGLYASGGWTFESLATKFGVTAMTAHRAVKGQSWSEEQ